MGILTSNDPTRPWPNIVLDNVVASGVGVFLQREGGQTLLAAAPGAGAVWTAGVRYIGGKGSKTSGAVPGIPVKDPSLTDGGKLFVKSRPQYEGLGTGSFLVATDNGISNDGKTDQHDKINTFLLSAASAGKIAYFPAGIYLITDTIFVPVGSKIQGSSWSQVSKLTNTHTHTHIYIYIYKVYRVNNVNRLWVRGRTLEIFLSLE